MRVRARARARARVRVRVRVKVRLMSLDALTAISTAALKLILGPLGVRVASWLGSGLGLGLGLR